MVLKPLYYNATGSYNTANGAQAHSTTTPASTTLLMVAGWPLFSTLCGFQQTLLLASNALKANITGSNHTANSYNALFNNDRLQQHRQRVSRPLLQHHRRQQLAAEVSLTLLQQHWQQQHRPGLWSRAEPDTTGSNNIAIGNKGVTAETGTFVSGATGAHRATYIAGIQWRDRQWRCRCLYQRQRTTQTHFPPPTAQNDIRIWEPSARS